MFYILAYFHSVPKVRIFLCSSDKAIETDNHHFTCKGSLRQPVGMKIAFRIVTILRLYPSSDFTPFSKSNIFGQHLYNSVCLIIYYLLKMLHLKEALFLFSLLSILHMALFSIQFKEPSQKNSIQLISTYEMSVTLKALG